MFFYIANHLPDRNFPFSIFNFSFNEPIYTNQVRRLAVLVDNIVPTK